MQKNVDICKNRKIWMNKGNNLANPVYKATKSVQVAGTYLMLLYVSDSDVPI